MKKILFLVNEYNSANGICVKNVMDCFDTNEYELFCVTNRESSYTNPFNENCKYFFVKPRLTYRLMKKMAAQKNSLKKRLLFITFFVCNKLSMLFSVPTWPLISRSFAGRVYKQAKKVCEKYEIDCIVPVYTQIDTLIAAGKLKKKKPNLIYIPYMLDSLAGGYGPKVFSKEWLINRGSKWERKLFASADRIVMMEASRNFYTSDQRGYEFLSKTVFTDLPMLVKPDKIKPSTVLCNEKTKVVYAGSLPLGIRDPSYAIDCFKRLDDVNLYIFGSTDNEDALRSMVKDAENIKLCGTVPHDEMNNILNEADFLLNLGNKEKSMVPSKIFEYLSYGKPIISFSPIEDEPSEIYLKCYPLSLILSENEEKASCAEKLKQFILANKDQTLDFDSVRQQFEFNTPEKTVEIIKEIVST